MREKNCLFLVFFGFLFSEQYFLCLNKINMYSVYKGIWSSSMHRSCNKRPENLKPMLKNTCATAGKSSENTVLLLTHLKVPHRGSRDLNVDLPRAVNNLF